MNSVYIDSSVASSPIYLGPTNASSVIIGNANCSTFVNGTSFGSDGAINLIGYNVSPTTSNASKPTGIEVKSSVDGNTNQSAKAQVDFHTNQIGTTEYDARIMASGGSAVTATNQQAILNYYARSHVFNGNVSMNPGSNITLQPSSGYVPPTPLTMLGGVTSGTTITTTAAASQTISSITLSAGVYIVAFKVHVTYVGAFSTLNYSFNTVTYGHSPVLGTLATTTAGTTVITTAGTYSLVMTHAGATTVAVTPASSFLTAVRIA